MQIMVKCCECNRIRVKDTWLTEQGIDTQDVVFSHSYCPTCLKRMLDEVDAWAAEPERIAPVTILDLHPVAGG